MPLKPLRDPLRIFRYAMYFDGVDDYVLVPNNPVFSGLNTITVMVFLNWLGTYGQVAIAKHANIAGRREWMIYVSLYTYRWGWQVFDDTAGTFSETFGSLPAPRLAHLTGVYNNGYQAIYENASLVSTRTTNIIVRSTTEPMNIGMRGDRRNYFNGYIYYVMLYTRALSSNEIAWNYNYPNNPVKNGLVLWLQADPQYIRDIDNDGVLEWIDLSGNGNHGKIYGATLVQLIKTPARVLTPARALTPVR
jgi:hypothetical protein